MFVRKMLHRAICGGLRKMLSFRLLTENGCGCAARYVYRIAYCVLRCVSCEKITQYTGRRPAPSEGHSIAVNQVEGTQDETRAKTLAVALALTVSAADKKMYHCEIEPIKKWAIGASSAIRNTQYATRNTQYATAFSRAVKFFRDGNQLDIRRICQEIVKICPGAIGPDARYDILDLCLKVAMAKGSVSEEELTILKNLACWLDVDTDRFRILLNKEYGKWNSRVTNRDPEIQSRASEMLKVVAQTRSQLVG